MLPASLLVVALLVYGYIVDPQTGVGGLPCLWKTVFGFTCPGCGLSRAGALLLRGYLEEAVAANWRIIPFGAVVLCSYATRFRDGLHRAI